MNPFSFFYSGVKIDDTVYICKLKNNKNSFTKRKFHQQLANGKNGISTIRSRGGSCQGAEVSYRSPQSRFMRSISFSSAGLC
jgi:hypothetical protein